MPLAEPEVASDVVVTVLDRSSVTLERVQLPERSAGEIDIAISTAAICGSDLHTVLGHRSTPPRTVLGHEGVGYVNGVDEGAVGLGGSVLRPGDRVVFAMFSSCGACDRCAAGLSMKCRSLLKYGHEPVTRPPHATGTLASGVRLLPGVPVLRIPVDVSDVDVVSAGCAVATAAAIVAAASPLPAEVPVLVLGAGAVGAYTAAMFASLRCTVGVRDPSEDRLALVEQWGATPDSGGTSFPIVVEASGSAEAVVDALHAADVGGHVIVAGSVSPGSSTVTFDPALVVTRRLTVTGLHNYTAEDFQRGVDWLLTRGRALSLDRLVSPPFPLSAVDEAFQSMRDGGYPRVIVRPDS